MDQFSMLENLIVEFYSFNINQPRRQEIENQLLAFESTDDVWKHCIIYIQYSNCNNVLVFSYFLRVIDSVITKKWATLSAENRTELQDTLTNYVLIHYPSIPLSASKNMMQLVAKINRLQWFHVESNLLPTVINMITIEAKAVSDFNTILFGLASLKIVSEELISPREEISTVRREKIKLHFENYLPQLFLILNETFRKYKGTDYEEKFLEHVLNVYLQLFSWVPLSDLYTIDLITPICECSAHPKPEIGTLALSVLNEILYKNCVPINHIPIVVSIILNLNELCINIGQMNVKDIPDEYLGKILEMMRLIISSHWHRIESNLDASIIMSLLSSFYGLTFSDLPLEKYYSCLEIWCSFLDYLVMRNLDHIQQYEESLMMLLEALVNKLQTKINSNNKVMYLNEEEEPGTFLNNHANLIDTLADLFPIKTFTFVYDVWNSASLIYSQLLNMNEQSEVLLNKEELLAILRMFEIATQIMTSLHSKIQDDISLVAIKNLANVTDLANIKQIHKFQQFHSISSTLIRIHCELLTAVSLWICYGPEKHEEIIKNLFRTTLPFVADTNSQHDAKLVLVAADAIARLVVCVKDLNMLQPLFSDPFFRHLQKDARKTLQRGLCVRICACKNESYDERLAFLKNLFETLIEEQIQNLPEVTALLQNCCISQSEGRDLMFSALKPWLEYVIEEYPRHIPRNPNYCDYLITFFLEAFRVVQDHMSSSLIQRILWMFDRIAPNSNVFSKGSYGIDKMLTLFTLLMEYYPSLNTKEYISIIISVSIKVLSHSSEGHDVGEIHKLLCSILLHKWQYFYKNLSGVNGKERVEHQEYFETILTGILNSFKQTDISVFCSNLRALEEIHKKWNLYNKDLFKVKYVSVFLNVLLNTMIDGTCKLYSDEILMAIYNMAAVNLEVFFGQYIVLFIYEVTGLTEAQRNSLKEAMVLQQDTPSFIQCVSRLINDIRSYRIENGANL